MKTKKIGIDFDLKFQALTDLNPSFAAARVAIAYPGRNRNRSDISAEVFEKALPSLANVPLVGHFDAETQDFGGHDIRVKIDDEGGVKVEAATTPFGVVPETMNAEWVDVTEADGTVRPYLFCDVLLWKRQPGYKCLASQESWHQSMEINVDQYYIDKDGYCVIEDMYFEALCILGNTVEPCFESASVQIGAQAAVTGYAEQFSLMMEELRGYYSAIKHNEGGEDGLTESKKLEILAKYGLKLEDISFEVTEDMTEEAFEAKVAEMAQPAGEGGDPAEGADPANEGGEQTFSATYNQKRDALRNALDPEYTRDGAGNIVKEVYFYLCDFDEKFVFVERDEWTQDDFEETHGRFGYEFDEATMTATLTTEFEKMILQWLTEEENAKLEQSRNAFETLTKEFSEYKDSHSHDNAAYEELNNFKMSALAAEHKVQVDEVLERFAELGESEEFKVLAEKAYDFEDLSDLEKECYAIKGKLAMNFAKAPKKAAAPKAPLSPEPVAKDELYGGLFAKYGHDN